MIKSIFRSIKVEREEDEQTGIFQMSFDKNSVMKHSVEISFADIIRNRATLPAFFVSLMCNFGIFGLVYAAAVIGFKSGFSGQGSNAFTFIFFTALAFSLVIIWFFFALIWARKNMKNDCVLHERGQGEWKIIDEKKWPVFERLLKIGEEEPW